MAIHASTASIVYYDKRSMSMIKEIGRHDKRNLVLEGAVELL